MRLSTKSRYGTRLLIDLACRKDSGYVQLGEIARRLDVSMKYLEQIILPLKRAKYVESIRGAKGGHRLAKKPEDISVGEVVSLLEGGPDLVACLSVPGYCDRLDSCKTRNLWRDASMAFFEKLNKVTLADLVSEGCDKSGI